MRYIQLFLLFFSSSIYGVEAYLIPDDHPAKHILDEVTKTDGISVFHDSMSMIRAGFDKAAPQPTTGIIVTRHRRLPGYVIKAYLDTQKYYGGRPEDYYWVKRVEGANLIRESIKKHNFGHLLKVPRKWIYKLPKARVLPLSAHCKPKKYILVEDDMDILSDDESTARWSSPYATKELLFALHTVITEHRFRDCAKPANCPFSKDGRVALVDTQSFHKKKIGYKKLTRYLTPRMQSYWTSLSHVGVK